LKTRCSRLTFEIGLKLTSKRHLGANERAEIFMTTMETNMTMKTWIASALAITLAACSQLPTNPSAGRSVTIERTAFGVAHITAPDHESLAFGTAYAHAQNNICLTAQQLVTVRGQRAATFGSAATGLLGLRSLPNEQIDFFIAAQMDDAKLAQAWSKTSSTVQSMARGYVAGYNRYLADHAGNLPAQCKGQPWVKPTNLAEFYRSNEISMVQAGIAAFADAMLAARPPAASAQAPLTQKPDTLDAKEAAVAMREIGVLDSPYGSNAWTFGKDVTSNGRGMLLGNPHFPWVGANRFWQMHLTIPGKLDVMGASIGMSPVVQIGFNKDVAWSHTVSTGKRFTLHELSLTSGDATSYVVDGKAEKMTPKKVSISIRAADGQISSKEHTVWMTRFGPVIVNPRAGLNWTSKNAYALQDANSGNARSSATWLAFAQAKNVSDMQAGMRNLGLPWVNTIAADRQGNAMYADMSVVPDVDTAHLARCAPSRPAAALLGTAGLVVLDGSRSECDWRRDASSPVPGITPPERLPVAVRSDWLHNSNDSFFYSHPAQSWGAISPLVGDDIVRRPRTRSGLIEVPDLVARGKVTLPAIQNQLFENRNLMARVVLPDLLAACTQAPSQEAKDGCAVMAAWNRTSELNAKGAPLFREFWRGASTIAGVHRIAFDKAQPIATPAGLNMANPEVATKVWDALGNAVKKIRAAGFAIDVALGQVQRPVFSDEPIFFHGGDEIEGVLNNVGDRAAPGMTSRGLRIDYGSSYIQTVTFDERGPVAQAILVYGQSPHQDSPHQTDQLKQFAAKQWPALPFHAEDVARQRVGEPIRLILP
jgi:acyl-homoserine-lactone acylase